MAINRDLPPVRERLAAAWDYLLAGRPLLPLTIVWLTTAGHTLNFREMGIGKGWVAADVYSLHSLYLVCIALALLAAPALGRRLSASGLTRAGLALLAAGSFLNGVFVHGSVPFFLVGRTMAGVGAGLVIGFAPRLLDARWENPTSFASILLPVAGPAAIAGASMIYGWSNWEWGFLVVGGAALLCMFILGSQRDAPPLPETSAVYSLAFLPFLTISALALLYCLHWGQLQGWLESADVVMAIALGTLSLALVLFLVYPLLDFSILAENWVRLLLFFFGGVVQFFHGTTMTIYSGMFVNFSPWQRSWLVWSMPLGVATSLVATRLAARRWRISLGLPGAIVGLLTLAWGMFMLHGTTLEWPYWDIRNVADLNWFQAPQHWELAPGRFVVGLGLGLFMFAADTLFSREPEREEAIRPFLLVTQFFGGGIGIGLLITVLLISHSVQYSYVAERDAIQAAEYAQRRAMLRDELSASGDPMADRRTDALLYRAVNYEADNLAYAEIYARFMVASLSLAGVCTGLLAWNGSRAPLRAPAR